MLHEVPPPAPETTAAATPPSTSRKELRVALFHTTTKSLILPVACAHVLWPSCDALPPSSQDCRKDVHLLAQKHGDGVTRCARACGDVWEQMASESRSHEGPSLGDHCQAFSGQETLWSHPLWPSDPRALTSVVTFTQMTFLLPPVPVAA